MIPDVTLFDLVRAQAGREPGAAAILSPDRPPLTYSRLVGQIENTVKALNTLGIGRGDRVGIVLPNGPEMAVAFLGVAAGAVAAPLNPDYGPAEFAFYLSDLKPKALIAQAGTGNSARAAARSLGLRILELVPVPESEAGLFDLHEEGAFPPGAGLSAQTGLSESDDVALVLHTSGTTSRPKVVPLTQGNISASARSIRDWLALAPGDRCLNVMPLFHVHGLVAGLLASLAAGASVVCPEGFVAPLFFDWLETFQPTWYSAVPTMHQAILARFPSGSSCSSPRAPEKCRRWSLRFIRSCSAALAPRLLSDLEETFGVPVIEAYGMTEASHQVASNPLPPGSRKPGSVGVATGTDIVILDEEAHPLPPGQPGEIAIRGPGVISGYEGNPEANTRSFAGGWFRTGDQGYLDADGYLYITGRLKELINRGGEKISPREVDEVLLEHPAVAQAVTFAMPDPRLGEEVAAAVVPRGAVPAAAVFEKELRDFAAGRLAYFKVPKRVVIVAEIPKGPTGKVQRLGLAARLGLGPAGGERAGEPVAPSSPLEERLASIWTEVLAVERVGVHDDFLDLGGDSVLAAKIIARVNDALGLELGILAIFEASTVAGLAAAISEASAEGAQQT